MRRRFLAIIAIGFLTLAGVSGDPAPVAAQDAVAAPSSDAAYTAPVPAGPSVTALGVTKDPRGTTITIHGDADLPYEYTTIEGKNLVIEIPGAGTKVWPATQQLDDPFVERIQVGELLSPKKMVRVVFDLKSAGPFSVKGEGPRIVLAFSAPAEAAAPAAGDAAPPARPAAPGRLNRVSGLQYKLVDGAMHIDVLADDAPDYHVLESDDPRLVTILVTNARIEPAAQKVDDLTSVNELVAKVTALQEKSIPPTVKLTIELRDPAPLHVARNGSALRITVSPGRGHGVATPGVARAASPPPPATAPAADQSSRRPALDLPPSVDLVHKDYVGRKITVDFVDADLKDIFQPIAEVSGRNIIFGDEVKGKRTLQLHDVQWDQALDMILKTNNPPLTRIEEPNGILRITTLQRVLEEGMEVEKKKQSIQTLADQKAQSDAAARIKELSDMRELEKARTRQEIIAQGLVERTFLISYASVDTITKSINKLTDQYSKIFTSSAESVSNALANAGDAPLASTTSDERRDRARRDPATSRTPVASAAALQMSYDACPGCLTEVDPRTSTIFIRTYPYYLDQYAAIIAALDKPTPSIMVEARIVEVQNDYSQNLGIQWGANFVADPAHGNAPPFEFPNSVNVGGTVNDATGSYLVNLPVAGAAGGLGISLGNIANTFSLDLRLSALERMGKTKILSNPKLLVLQSEKARIQIGEQLPMTLSDVTETSTTSTVQWKDVGIILEVTPRVTYDNRVNLEVLIEKSSKGANVITTQGENFSVVTNKATTKVLVDNGSTAVIGGLFTQTATDGSDGIPGLSKLPFLGWLFKSKNATENRKELLIFLTPRILTDAR